DLNGNLLVVTGSVPPNDLSTGSVYIFEGAEDWKNYKETIILYSVYSELFDSEFGHSTAAIYGNSLLVAALPSSYLNLDALVYNYNRVNTAEFHLRVVDSPTSTTPAGEVSSLPLNQGNVTEWSSYWVEIWVKSNDLDGQGVLSAELDFNYNTQYTSATDIEFGASFTQNQTGDIYDPSGIIAGLFAETTAADLGTDDYLLFARIKFESLAEDQLNLDLSGKSIGPRTLGFYSSSQEVKLVGDITAVSDAGQFNSARIWANPYDLNDDGAVNFRDLMLFASVYGSVPSESESTYSWFADFDHNNNVNFRDLVSFAANYGKSKLNQLPVNYPPNYPDAWNQLLVVDSQSALQADAPTVTQSAAETVLKTVVEQVRPDLSDRQQEILEQVDIEVVDLAGDTLGRAAAGTIYIDVNAAGRGWFVDATPADHSEFAYASELTLVALPAGEAAAGIDLWTVILHELGHLLGYEHEAIGLMQDTLAPGVRHLPDWDDDSDRFFAGLTEESNLIIF
ncbi:MAG: hypothetical protein KDA77_09780, partial [Planctomycetaceae bacterium]|nr:hypothetical protein [Planctomycetaceae bacterium]